MPSALIADDEPLLAQALRAELARQWPELEVLATVGDGLSAAQQALDLRPDVLFLDIRMPGQDGLSAAAQIADEWSSAAGPLPLLIFVTAFEQHAIAAFDAQALDYVLKPVDGERLHKTVNRLQAALRARAEHAGSSKPNFDVSQWQALLQAALEAQADALKREDEAILAEIELNTHTVLLYKALGGGWSPDEPVKQAQVAVTVD